MNGVYSVAVVIAAFNAEHTLPLTLRSVDLAVCSSTLRETRIIIVDDGSTIPVTDYIDPHDYGLDIEIVRLGENHGLWFARNIGAQCSTSDYITFVDADDYVLGNFFLALIRDLENSPKAVARGYCDWFPENGEMRQVQVPLPKVRQQPLQILQGCFMPSFSTVRRDVFVKLGGFRPEVTEDWDFWIRFFSAGFTAMPSSEISYLYRIRSGSLSRRGDQSLRDLLTLQQASAEVTGYLKQVCLKVSVWQWSSIIARSESLNTPEVQRQSVIFQRIETLVQVLLQNTLRQIWNVCHNSFRPAWPNERNTFR